MKNIKFVFFIILLVSCHKYEQGPTVSFKTVKQRIVYQWRIASNKNGDHTPDDDFYIKFTRSGNFERGTYMYATNPVVGVWKLSPNKRVLIFGSGENTECAHIIRLTSREFFLVEKGDTIYLFNN